MSDTRTTLAVCVLLLIAGALPVAASSVGTATTMSISMGENPGAGPGGTIATAPGENVTVFVWANATNVTGYQANVTFDPAVVQVETVSGSSEFTDPVVNANDSAGWVAFNQLRSSEVTDPVLAEITFAVADEASETSNISFVETDVKFATGDGETFSPDEYGNVTLQIEESSTTPTPTATPTPTPTATPTPSTTPSVTPTPTPSPTPNPTPTAPMPTPNQTPSLTATPTPTTGDGGSSGGGSGGGGGSVGGTPDGNVQIVDRTLLNGTVSPASDVVVRVGLSNLYPARGRITLNLTADRALATQRTVTVGVDEQRTALLRTRFDAPGRYEIRLNGVSVGTVRVLPATVTATERPTATRTPTSASTRTLTPTSASSPGPSTGDSGGSTPTSAGSGTASIETTSGSGPGFGVRVLIGAIGTLAGWSAVRRERSS